MQVSKKMLALAGFAAVALVAAPAFAHHSFAMFDSAKNVTLEGTIKEFQWTNPHSWIQIVVKDASGKDVEYSIEGGEPQRPGAAAGWKRTSLEAGRQGGAVIMHPLKDGTAGGSSLVTVSVGSVQVSQSPLAKPRRLPRSRFGRALRGARLSCPDFSA